jgi:cell filamentation protein
MEFKMKASDPYVYPESGTLINRLSEKNQASLQEAETLLSGLRLSELLDQPLPDMIDFEYLKKLHGFVFQDIYPEWAGTTRTIQTTKKEATLGGKTVKYSSPDTIASEADNTFDILGPPSALQKLDLEELGEKLTAFLTALWKIHPFREGNTRVIFLLVYKLSIKAERPLSLHYLNRRHRVCRQALVKSTIGSDQKISHIIKEAIEKNTGVNRFLDLLSRPAPVGVFVLLLTVIIYLTFDFLNSN